MIGEETHADDPQVEPHQPAVRRARRGRRGRGDRGVAMVEMAIVAPLLALLVAGIVEFGTLWRDNLTVTSATRSGARVVSAAGTATGADYEAIQSVRAALTSIDGVTVEGMLIYRASATDGAPDPQCFDASGNPQSSAAGACNYYSASQIQTLTAASFAGCSGPDAAWCPSVRDDQQSGGTDQIGVWLRVSRPYYTGIIPGNGVTMTDSTVMNIEPVVN